MVIWATPESKKFYYGRRGEKLAILRQFTPSGKYFNHFLGHYNNVYFNHVKDGHSNEKNSGAIKTSVGVAVNSDYPNTTKERYPTAHR